MSGGGMPELGSKISLISKADIRYEGRLYTVDPQECTIALSSVRSFGTEDRETQFQIAPQSQIYDYILFRGSDIKDIRVVNNNLPHPNDPAIMQVQLPNGQHIMPTHFPIANMNAPHAPPMGAGSGYPFGGMAGTGGGLPNMAGGASGGGVGSSSLAPGAGAPGPFMHMAGNQQQQQQQQQQQKSQQQQKQPISVIDMLAGASRSTTPISLISRKSPSAEMGGGNQQQQQQQAQMHQQQNNAGHGGNGRDAGHKRQNHQQRGGPNNHQQQRNNNNHNDYYNHPHQQQQLHNNRDRRDSGRNMDNQYNHNNYNNNQRNNHQGGQNRWNMHRGGPMNGNNMMRNRNPGGMRGRMQNQGFRPMGGAPGGIGGNQNKQRNNKIKFEQDFDFEQANNKFEELRSQLAKLKVGDDAKSSEQLDTPAAATNLQMNGETDKKDDSGNETGAGEHEPEDEEIHVGYDKTKSFFDNISCEAAQDRSKNKKNDWRQERKLNSETFGVSSTRRGSYRGRGNYYNRNAGGGGNYSGGGNMGGGGYRNYRGGNNQYRNRSNNRNNNHGNTNNNNNIGGNSLNAANNNNNSAANTVAALKQQVQQQSPIVNAGSEGGVDSTTTTKTTTTLREIIKPDTVKTIGQQCFANANGTESL